MFSIGFYGGGVVMANVFNLLLFSMKTKPPYSYFGLVWPCEVLRKDWWLK